MRAIDDLSRLLSIVPSRLETIPNPHTQIAPDKWSPKQELGHLLDSAVNNLRRVLLIQLEDKPALCSYDGERWVEVQEYQNRDWHELIQLWRALNQQLLTAAAAVKPEHWTRVCTIGGSEPLTLRFVVEDYVAHMLHHLRHMGVEVDDLKSSTAA
jgi:DinB superfamily